MKKWLVLFIVAISSWSASAWTVFDPWNFAQNIRQVIQSLVDERSQMLQLAAKHRDMLSKGTFVGDPQVAVYSAAYYQRMAENDKNLYGQLEDVQVFADEMNGDYQSSGLTPEEWAASERELYRRGYKKQRVRVQRANEWRGTLSRGLEERRRLMADNRAAAGSVAATQTTNEYLALVVERLDILIDNIALEEKEQAEEGALEVDKQEKLTERKERYLKEGEEQAEAAERMREKMKRLKFFPELPE